MYFVFHSLSEEKQLECQQLSRMATGIDEILENLIDILCPALIRIINKKCDAEQEGGGGAGENFSALINTLISAL